MLPKIGSLWIGDKLGPIEELCLSSMIMHGHSVTLYSYKEFPVPEGVIIKDANEIISHDKIFMNRKIKSPATFADFFRIKMIQETGLMWMDTDILLLEPFDVDQDYFFDGFMNKGKLAANNCILLLPSSGIIIDEINSYLDNPKKILSLLSLDRSARLYISYLVKRKWTLENFPWGAFGFIILTEILKKNNMEEHINMQRVSHLIEKRNAFKPVPNLEKIVSELRYVHFTSSKFLKHSIDFVEPVENSFYKYAIEKYGKNTSYFCDYI